MIDTQYKDLLKDILENGVRKTNRTGVDTISVFGRQIRHDMGEGFPVLTTKKMHFKSITTELLWFLRGDTNIKYLVENGCHIWDGDAYKSYCNIAGSVEEPDYDIHVDDPIQNCTRLMTKEEFINKIKTDNEFAEKWGSLGKIYGHQWRNWERRTTREEKITNPGIYIEIIDQIQNLINDLKTNPDSRRLMVTAWNPADLKEMVLPPCFTEDIMVACVDGYRKISEITENDLVLTEDGSYQKVYELHETKYDNDLVKFKVFGNTKDITCTPNHPFLVKDKGYVNANELNENDYLAIPINKKSIIPSFDIWLKDNQYTEKLITTKLDNFDYWFLMGYFLGDGWLVDSKEEIYFAIKNEQIDLILPRLKNIIGLAKLNNSGVNCTKYVGKKKQVFEILSKFGKYADGKFIPTFIHDAPKEYIEQFIDGYLMADGCKTKNGISYTTVSENIAYGLQLLYAKLGIKASVYFQNRPKKTIIDGREVNQKNTFLINVYKQKNKSKKYILDTDYLWVKIKEIDKIEFSGYVYNISVKNNHTYNVYNLINHNCHYGFQVYTRELTWEERRDNIIFKQMKGWTKKSTTKQLRKLIEKSPRRAISLMFNMRSNDVPLGLPFNIASYALLLEIIGRMVNMIPDQVIASLGDAHIYVNQIDGIKKQLSRDPYPLPKLIISDDVDFSGNIDDFLNSCDKDSFKLENYKSHPAIKIPLSN